MPTMRKLRGDTHHRSQRSRGSINVMPRHEIRHMEAAITLAEELNFSRAAQRLRISQPTLTLQIGQLEERFSMQLFDRNHQKVALTEAGRVYLEQARLSLLHSERAVQAARSTILNAPTVLRVGKSPHGDPFFVSLLQTIRLPLFPQLQIELSSGFSAEILHGLLSGFTDLAVLVAPPETASISMTVLADEPFYITMGQDDPLAAKPSVGLKDLKDRCCVMLGHAVHSSLYDTLESNAAENNIRFSEVHHVLAPEEAFHYVMDREGLAILTKTGALQIARGGLTMRPLSDPRVRVRTFLASRSDNQSKLTSEMVRAFGRKIKSLS